jgi:hypothetical protein
MDISFQCWTQYRKQVYIVRHQSLVDQWITVNDFVSRSFMDTTSPSCFILTCPLTICNWLERCNTAMASSHSPLTRIQRISQSGNTRHHSANYSRLTMFLIGFNFNVSWKYTLESRQYKSISLIRLHATGGIILFRPWRTAPSATQLPLPRPPNGRQ